MYAVARVAFIAAVLIIFSARPVSARTAVGAYTTNSGIGASANQDASGSITKKSSTAGPICTSQAIKDGPDAVVAFPDGSSIPVYNSTHPATAGTWIWKQCTDSNGTIISLTNIWVPNADPAAIAQQALANQSLPVPSVSINPPLPGGAIVNYATWLWIDPVAWRPIAATAAVNGISITASATPSKIIWNMGDGHSVTCAGPGVKYDESKPPSQQRSDCTYTFTRSSAPEPGHVFTVTATVQWVATWRASDGTTGSLGTINRATALALPVREIQAINIAPTGNR